MRCARCQADNRQGRRYCRICGLLLRVLCDECGFDNFPGDRFCGGCGKCLTASPESLDADGSLDLDAADAALSPSPNRLASLLLELPPAPQTEMELGEGLLMELDDSYIEGEP